MIEAKHRKWAEFFFKPYIFKSLKKHFRSFQVLGEIPLTDKNIPIILTPNHSTWWDGFFVYLLNKKLFNRKFYIMIMEEQLSKYKFFPKLGGFSIERGNPKKIIQSLKYTSEIMDQNKNSIINIFPQGEVLPNISEIKYNNGISKILKFYENDVYVLNVAMKPLFLKQQTPQMFFKFGTLNKTNYEKFDIKKHNDEIIKLMKEIDENIKNNEFGQILLDGKKTIAEQS